MTGKERALRAIWGKQTDRPSVLPSIDVAYAPECIGRNVGECFRDPKLHAQALMGALDTYPEIDGLYVNLCLSDSHLTRQTNGLFDDGYGLHWYVPENDVGTVKAHEIEELDDPRIDGETSLRFGPLETFAAIKPEYKENYLIMPGITGPYSQLVFMMGLENVLIMMYDDPEGLKEAIGKRVSHAIAWLDELITLGADAVWIGEGAASSSVISPACYAEFVAPYARAVVDAARQRNIPCFMHVCGNIVPAIREIAATGLSAIDIDYMVPMALAREHCGENTCLKGNLNPMDLLNRTPEEIYGICREIYRQAHGPMILGTGCLVAPRTPKENINAMVRASKSMASQQ
ncbi:MAG: hypothetical protein J6A88_01780 [Oscillospiraceae bacterium]|nr:hypothetical protein [Oscillospiraceae bacterium]